MSYVKLLLNLLFPPKGPVAFVRLDDKTLAGLPHLNNQDKANLQAVVSYKHRTVRAMIWNIKYKKNPDALYCGGYLLYNHIKVHYMIAKETLYIVPIPVSPSRRRERGYNQCELLAQVVVALDTSGSLQLVPNLLLRIKNTEKQTFKSRKERLASMEKVFSLNRVVMRAVKKDVCIVVLDDVITTGSTLRAAIECFRESGYKNVWGLGLAH